MPVLFCDLPDEKRMGYRDAVYNAGGYADSYNGENIQVACPRPFGPFNTALREAGLELVEESMYYFPLGSDQPPEEFRHDGRYPGSKGFWLYASYRPAR